MSDPGPAEFTNVGTDAVAAQAILRGTRAVIYLYDPHNGRSLFQNRPLFDLAGYDTDPGVAIGNDWLALMHEEDRARFPLHREKLKTLRAGETAEFEFRLRDQGGGWREAISQDTPYQLDRSGRAAIIVGHVTDITAQKRAEARLALLLREFTHRMKNLHAMILAIVSLTYRSKPSDFIAAVSGRLRALSSANDMLSGAEWNGLGLYNAIRIALEPHGAEDRAALSGPDIALSGAAAEGLALTFNELATNAVKYGALSASNGHVSIDIAETANGARIEWRETGGPPVSSPGRTSFGTQLIRRSVEGIGGKVAFDWLPGGLVCQVQIPANAPGGHTQE